jgi:hypothetical protein
MRLYKTQMRGCAKRKMGQGKLKPAAGKPLPNKLQQGNAKSVEKLKPAAACPPLVSIPPHDS